MVTTESPALKGGEEVSAEFWGLWFFKLCNFVIL